MKDGVMSNGEMSLSFDVRAGIELWWKEIGVVGIEWIGSTRPAAPNRRMIWNLDMIKRSAVAVGGSM